MTHVVIDSSGTARTLTLVTHATAAAAHAALSGVLAALRMVASAMRLWWIERTASAAFAGLDDASLRDLAVARSDAERVVHRGRD